MQREGESRGHARAPREEAQIPSTGTLGGSADIQTLSASRRYGRLSAARDLPDYNRDNPLAKLIGLNRGAATRGRTGVLCREQHAVPLPNRAPGALWPERTGCRHSDPTHQDNKSDFQKQNVKDFTTADTRLVRGLVQARDWSGPFLRLSCTAGPDSLLTRAGANPGRRSSST